MASKMVGCSVFGCKSNTNSQQKEANVTFHRFPTEDETRNKWIAVTGKRNWAPHKNSRICSKHFEQHCFRKTQKLTFIEKLSIPTLFIHKFPECIHAFSQEVEVEPLPTEFMDCQRQPDTHTQAQQLSVTVKSEVKVEPLPTEFMDCQRQPDTHTQAQQLSVTVKSEFPALQEVKVEPLPTEFMDCQRQPDTHTQAQQLSVTVKSIECHNSSNKSMPRTEDPTMSIRKYKHALYLKRQTRLAESRRKKAEALRSKIRRLQKKSAELSAIIENSKTERFTKQESADLAATNKNNSDFLKVREFASNLHFTSARADNFAGKHGNTCLPHTRPLAWYETVDGEPGVSSESLKLLATSNPNKKSRPELLAESRRKKIEALRSKSRRLRKKNAELSAVIENLKSKGFRRSSGSSPDGSIPVGIPHQFQ